MSLMLKVVRFVARLLMGLAAGVSCAHVLELPNKMALSAQDYLLVQQHLYEGWGRVLGPVEMGALLATVVAAALVWKRHVQCVLTFLAGGCMAAALVIFGLYISPVNTTVDAWTATTMPVDWMAYRDRWEYAHATRAVLLTLGFGLLIVTGCTDSGPRHSPGSEASGEGRETPAV